MKRIAILLTLTCALFACNKKDDPAPVPVNPYYFRFNLNGKAYDLKSEFPQYLSSDERYAGGFQQIGLLEHPSIGLEFGFDSTVSDAQVKALAGKTLYYNGTNPKPSLDFNETISGNTLYSIDTANTAFNINVSSVSYLKVDTTIFNIVDVYVIKGTCSAVLEDLATGATSTLSNGEFNFLISRVKR